MTCQRNIRIISNKDNSAYVIVGCTFAFSAIEQPCERNDHESSSFAMEIYDDDSGAIASETFQTFLERTLEKISFPCLRPVSTIYLYHIKRNRKWSLLIVPNENTFLPFFQKIFQTPEPEACRRPFSGISTFRLKSLILSTIQVR